MLKLLGRGILAFIALMALWIGGAQLGVVLLGPENDATILFAMVGMLCGIGAGLEILSMRP